MRRILAQIRKALALALDHDVFSAAKAAAYSGMLFSFPAVLVMTTLLARVPEGTTLVGEVRSSLDQFLPADSMDLLQSALETKHYYSAQVLLSATSLSIFAGLGLMLSLMEGFRRAYELPRDEWCYRQRVARAFMLVPIVLVPLWLASLLLVFGQQIEHWMINNCRSRVAPHGAVLLESWFAGLWRWPPAWPCFQLFITSARKRREHWKWVIPGALGATAVWFPATLLFGWYVTRVADYSMFYGSFAAGIATLVWLYITSLSALLGAELNGVLFRARQERLAANTEPPSVASRL